MSSDWDDDDIGYGRPPRWTQFEKGRSGNPKGRPKKPKESPPVSSVLPDSAADRALRKELDRPIRVTDAQGTKEVTMAEAIVRAQVTKAAQGHVPAIRDVRRAQRELERVEAERSRLAAEQAAEEAIERKQMRETVFKYMYNLKQTQIVAWEEAARTGLAEPDHPWPHPEDIHLNAENQSYYIRGPYNAEHALDYRFYQALRDKHFVETIIWMRGRRKAAKAKASFYVTLMGIFDTLLPKRWALGCSGFEFMAEFYVLMPLKWLREDLERSEQKVRLLMPARLAGPVRQGEFYESVNRMMKPVLKKMGYVSYAQFERAFEDSGGNPPWPRAKKSAA